MLTENNKKDRRKFAREMREQKKVHQPDEWKKLRNCLLFTDESLITLLNLPNTQNFRIRTSNSELVRCISQPKFDEVSVLICGGLTSKGLTQLKFFFWEGKSGL